MKNLANWTPRLPMTAAHLVGQHVRIDPLQLDTDAPLLWNALGGIADNPIETNQHEKVNERLFWYGLPELQGPSDLATMLSDIEKPEGCCVSVFRLEPNGEVAGMASYIATVADHGVTEVGYVAHGSAMAKSAAATEAHYLLAKHAFEISGYRRYEWKCDSKNEPSHRAALRLGFQFESTFRQHRVTAHGTNRDTSWFSMLDGEWPSLKTSFERWLDPANIDPQGNQRKRLQDIRIEVSHETDE